MDPWKSQLRELNPRSKRELPADEDALPESAMTVARQGYETLNRANPRSYWNPNRPTLAPPVYDDGPKPDFD